MLIVYCVIRFFTEKRKLNELGGLLLRFIGSTCIGIGIGIGLVLPGIMNMMNLDRLGADVSYPILDLATLKEQLLYAFSYHNLWHESIWGFSALSAVALILLFRDRKTNLSIKIVFVIFFASFFIPFVGSMMNGLNYPANRYVFGFSFLLAYLVALMVPRFDAFRGRVFAGTLAVSVIYLVIVLFQDMSAKLSGISLVLMVCGIGLSNHLLRSDRARRYSLVIMVMLSCLITGVSTWHETSHEYIDLGTANDSLMKYTSLAEGYDATQIRYDIMPYSYTDVSVNSSMISGKNSYDFYHSNYNNYIDHYYDDLAVVSNAMGFQQTGLRGRNLLELQNGTEYIFRQNTEDRTIRAPYSYELIDESDDYDVYRTSRGASMVYFYDEAVSYDDYLSCDPIEREELTTRYCVIDGAASVRPGSTDDHNELNYDICTSGDLSFDNGSVNVTSDSGYIELDIPDTENKEINVLVSGLNHEGDYYYQFAVVLMDGDKAIAADFFAGIDKGFAYYHGKEDLLFSFGCIEDKIDSIRLYFNTPGEYSLGDVSVYTRDIDQLDILVNDFYDHADMDDVSYEIIGNHINISAVADRDKYLYIAVPYSEGWTAAIDGEKAEIMRANEAFIVLKVPAGSHEVQLNYKTPYLAAGFSISMITTAGFIVFEIMKKRFR